MYKHYKKKLKSNITTHCHCRGSKYCVSVLYSLDNVSIPSELLSISNPALRYINILQSENENQNRKKKSIEKDISYGQFNNDIVVEDNCIKHLEEPTLCHRTTN